MIRKPINKILITGAGGGIGKMLRRDAKHLAKTLRLSDREDLGGAAENEEIVVGNISDPGFAFEITRDVDAVFHFGGKSIEGKFEEILNSNIIGAYNIFEGCRRNKVKRLVFASSNHAIGFHSRTSVLKTDCQVRPDSNYGVSKVYGEALAQLYWDKYGLETVSIRIGSCFAEPRDLRMMSTWLSQPDMVHLLERCLAALSIEHTIVYGVSNNAEKIWDNTHAAHLGFDPKDSSESFRQKLEAQEPEREPHSRFYTVQGGAFAVAPHFEDPN